MSMRPARSVTETQDVIMRKNIKRDLLGLIVQLDEAREARDGEDVLERRQLLAVARELREVPLEAAEAPELVPGARDPLAQRRPPGPTPSVVFSGIFIAPVVFSGIFIESAVFLGTVRTVFLW